MAEIHFRRAIVRQGVTCRSRTWRTADGRGQVIEIRSTVDRYRGYLAQLDGKQPTHHRTRKAAARALAIRLSQTTTRKPINDCNAKDSPIRRFRARRVG